MNIRVKKEMSYGYNESDIFYQLKPKIDAILDNENSDAQRQEFLERIH